MSTLTPILPLRLDIGMLTHDFGVQRQLDASTILESRCNKRNELIEVTHFTMYFDGSGETGTQKTDKFHITTITITSRRGGKSRMKARYLDKNRC